MSFNISTYISNLNYINKDFNSTWEEILEVVPKLTNKWNPNESNESDPLVVLLKELGIVTDKINYNVDKNTLEAFPDLLTQLRAAYSVFGSMGYVPQWYRSALVNVTFLYNGGAGATTASSVEAGIEWTLPRFTAVSNEDYTAQYVTLEPLTFTTGEISSQQVLAIEGTLNDLEVNGSTQITLDCLDSSNRLYFLQPNVAQNGIFISSSGTFDDISIEDTSYDVESTGEDITWHRVTNLYQQLPGNKVFKFGIDPVTGSTYIQFPDDIGDLIGSGLYIKYILSNGESGNIKSGTITDFPSSISISPDTTSSESLSITSADNLTVSNNASTQNGKDPETIEEMQANYNRVVGTFNTLVTIADYENYLYTRTDAVGRPFVSNIKVSDRSTDLYTSYSVKTLNINGDFSTKKGQNPSADTEIADEWKEGLQPYDLRFYPVGNGQTVADLTSFNASFDYATKENTKESLKDILENELADAKAIVHDYREFGAPIFLDYELTGQIYLQKTLSKEEAAEVKSNVDLALYKKLEARQLTFGKEINYSDVVDTIKNADPRIQYVALDPINYRVDEATLDLHSSRSGYDVVKKSILAGNTPWTQIESMRYYWGTTSTKSYGKTDSSGTSNLITSISPQVSNIEWDKDAEGHTIDNQYTVKTNETFYILAPGYTTKTTYGNYFYMISNVPLEKDVPTQLEENQTIEIYEERPTSTTNPKDAAYTIGSGTIVKCNVAIAEERDEQAKYKVKKAINMGSNITLEILDADITTLSNTYPSYKGKGIKFTTNAKGLISRLKVAKKIEDGKEIDEDRDYTLNVGEYIFWTDVLGESTPITEIGIIGEGNTLKWSTEDLNPTSLTNIQAISASDTAKADYNGFPWITAGDKALSYRSNTLYSFGEGTTVKFSSAPWKKTNPETGTETDYYSSTQIFPLNSGIVINYKTKDSEEFEELPGILENDIYSAFVGLTLTVSPERVQKLGANQEIVLTLKNEETDEVSKQSLTGENTYIQANSVIIYAGGQPLELSDSESKSLTIKKLTGSNLSAASTSFISNEPFPLPSNVYILYASINDSDEVEYYIGQGGQVIVDSEEKTVAAQGKKVGLAYQLKSGATYWTGEKSVELSGGPGNLKLDENYIYNPLFSPVYQPSDADLIEDPLDAKSYFKSNHVCNKYVLPKLTIEPESGHKTPLDNLKISPLSIRS